MRSLNMIKVNKGKIIQYGLGTIVLPVLFLVIYIITQVGYRIPIGGKSMEDPIPAFVIGFASIATTGGILAVLLFLISQIISLMGIVGGKVYYRFIEKDKSKVATYSYVPKSDIIQSGLVMISYQRLAELLNFKDHVVIHSIVDRIFGNRNEIILRLTSPDIEAYELMEGASLKAFEFDDFVKETEDSSELQGMKFVKE